MPHDPISSTLTDLTATQLVEQLITRQVSALELLEAYAARIDACNAHLNAIITLDLEGARQRARAIDLRRMRGDALGALAGLPIAIKDTELTRGMRTTYGSAVHSDLIPDRNAAVVDRLIEADINIVGKTNVPEFGMGSHTFNTLFGATRNPWHLERSAGGSSGGAAAAVAARMMPFADGSDFGGSLRNPASFNNLIGLRTAVGRIARYPVHDAFAGSTVLGPIARSAADAALLLSVMAGPDARDPLSIDVPGEIFRASLQRDFNGARIGFSADLGGLPIAPDVADATRRALSRLEALGCVIEPAEPDFSGADFAFETLRAAGMASQHGALLKSHRADLKDTAIWNIEAGFALDGAAIAKAMTYRSRLFHAMRTFLQRYDYLVAPVSQVAPFAIDLAYPNEIAGTKLEHYLGWMRSCTRISVTSHPAISIPGEFTAEGLPVGLQVVAGFRNEFSLLQLAHALESVGDIAQRRPPEPNQR